MSIFSFSKSWKPLHKGFYYLLLSVVLGLSICYCYFLTQDDAISISWILASYIETVERPLTYISDSFLQIPIIGEHFLIKESYLAGDYDINSTWVYLFLALFWVCLMIILAVSTFMSRTWYLVSMGLFILTILGLQPEQLLLFGWTGKKSLLLFLSAYLIPSFVFNSFRKEVSFSLRLGTFIGISILLGVIIYFFSDVSMPFYYLVSYGYVTFLFMSLLFILIIAHEIVFGILFLSTYSKSRKNRNTLNFALLSFVYLSNLCIIYFKNRGGFDFEIVYVNTGVISIISMIIGFWGFGRKEELYKNIFSFNPYGIWLYTSLAAIFIGFSSLLMYFGNDPALEVIEDAVTFSHIGFGSIFFVYLLVNFGKAIGANHPVYKIAYKERNMPYFIVNIAGLIIAYMLFSNSHSVGYYQAYGGYYNQLGDLYLKEGKTFLADQYYLESSIWGYKNHKANYSLARLYLRQEKYKLAEKAYQEALKKNPAPQTYVNLAQLYTDQGKFFDALFALKDGISTFPNNQKIKNNLGLQYEKVNFADSAQYYFTGGDFNSIESVTSQINLSYLGAKNGLPISKDSLKSLIQESKEQSVISNLLAYKNTTYPKLEIDHTFSGQFKSLNSYNASYLYNNLISQIYIKGEARNKMIQSLEEALQNPKNKDYMPSLYFLKSISAYYNGDISTAFEEANNLRVSRLDISQTYSRLLGLWSLEQGQPQLAIDYLSKAQSNPEKSDVAYLLALMNNGSINEIPSEILSSLPYEDSILVSNGIKAYGLSFAEILNEENDSLKYLSVKYNFKDYDIEISKVIINSIKDESLRNSLINELILWNINRNRSGIVNTLLNLSDSSVNFNDYKTIVKLMSNGYQFKKETRFSSSYYQYLATLSQIRNVSDSLTAERAFEIGQKTPFNIPQVLTASELLTENYADKAYNLLLKVGELNPSNTAISRAYIELALMQGLTSYAEDELDRIQQYASNEEYENLRFIIHLAKLNTNDDDEAW